MMRQFYLVNEIGQSYFFDYRNHTLISGITNLGFTKNNTYLKYDDEYSLVKSENPQGTLQFKVVFLKGYSGYNDFLKFLRNSNDDIRFFYKYDNSPKYCYVRVKSLSKTELESGVLICDLVLDKLSLWLLKESVTIRVNEDKNGKIFPFTYPFTYSTTYNGTITLINNGETKAPLNVSIYGAVNDPQIEIYKNGSLVSKLRLILSSDDCEIEICAEPRNQYMLIRENGEEKNIYQYQDFTCDNFLFLEKGNYQIKFSPGVSEDTFCRITKIEGYSGH